MTGHVMTQRANRNKNHGVWANSFALTTFSGKVALIKAFSFFQFVFTFICNYFI